METRTYKRRPGACEGCKNRKLKCDGGEPTCNKCQANGHTCRYPPRKKRGRPRMKGRKSISSTAAASSMAFESPIMPFNQAESHRSDVQGIWPSPPTFDMDGSGDPSSTSSHQFDDLSISDSLLLEGGQDSNVIDLFDTSQRIFDNVSLTALSPISPEFRTIDGKSELQSKVAELYQSFDVVDFSGTTLLSRITTFNSTHNLTSEPMEKAIQDILSQMNLPVDKPETINGSMGQEDDPGLLRSCLTTFLGQPYMGANFIDRDRLFRLFDEIVVNKRDDAASIALVYGAVATGAKHERVRNPNKCNDPAIATRHFEKAVGMFQRLGGKYTITKFKAALTLGICKNDYLGILRFSQSTKGGAREVKST
ncbi:hypothetical protein GTA08_BOTSDO01353 [Botryosphaeria dothidea]|uniref:Zn(2)-C6 fungal-type domain-containing protein n=1 Tax=Botryosphaeria dothidea TaxID=55169 RepID=A0A8H4NA49_9PEZI|nr:hypothetical protein GTA08_BOTSDO01353 [Botryosphaeria dothidea]